MAARPNRPRPSADAAASATATPRAIPKATPTYPHLTRLTTTTGLYEHALGTVPRVEHGMCVDDVARALVVTSRTPEPTAQVRAMSRIYLTFLLAAQHQDGLMHNRRDPDGTWLDEPSADDQWGRALWAFGTAAAQSTDVGLASQARAGAVTAMRARSPHPRAMAYAALGAVQLLRVVPDDLSALHLLHDARLILQTAPTDRTWPWPYERLTYANAVLPEAMIAVGRALHDGDLRRHGLVLLAWLEDQQTVDGHLSVVPAGGRSPGDPRPGFDQQPIEVAALAEAGRTAHLATRDDRWTTLLERCVAWFEGDNDSAVAVRDPATGGGFDGLEVGSVNQNQGAESTLAWLSTNQLAQAIGATRSR